MQLLQEFWPDTCFSKGYLSFLNWDMRAALLLENILWINEVSYSSGERADVLQMKSLPCRKTKECYMVHNTLYWDLHSVSELLHYSSRLRVCPLWMWTLMNSFPLGRFICKRFQVTEHLTLDKCLYYWNQICKHAYAHSQIHLFIAVVTVFRGENIMQFCITFKCIRST